MKKMLLFFLVFFWTITLNLTEKSMEKASAIEYDKEIFEFVEGYYKQIYSVPEYTQVIIDSTSSNNISGFLYSAIEGDFFVKPSVFRIHDIIQEDGNYKILTSIECTTLPRELLQDAIAFHKGQKNEFLERIRQYYSTEITDLAGIILYAKKSNGQFELVVEKNSNYFGENEENIRKGDILFEYLKKVEEKTPDYFLEQLIHLLQGSETDENFYLQYNIT